MMGEILMLLDNNWRPELSESGERHYEPLTIGMNPKEQSLYEKKYGYFKRGNKHIKIGVIFPSRGLIFSQTADELLQNLKGHLHKIYFAHKLPIPDCFEIPVNRALEDQTITHLWLVEDDMVLPPTILQDMLDINKAVVTVNYPTSDKGDCAILTVKNRIVYGGTGCTLIKREVFDELKKPYFRSDIIWSPRNMGSYVKFIGSKPTVTNGYGLHDVNFFINLYKLGIPVHKLPYTIEQRKLVSLGKSGSNNGAHVIEIWRKCKKDRYFDLAKHMPKAPQSTLTTVVVDNREILLSQSHAKKLIKLGMATKPSKRYVAIDDSEVI